MRTRVTGPDNKASVGATASKKRKRFTVVGALIVLLLVAGGIVAAVVPSQREYSQAAKSNFLAGCEEGKASKSVLCHCTLAKVEAHYSLAEVETIEADQKRGVPLPRRLTSLAAECLSPNAKSARAGSALKRGQDEFIAWYAAWLACLTPNGTTLHDADKQLVAAVKGTSAAAARHAANSALTANTESASCMARLPAGTPDLANADRKLVASSQLEVHAYQIYREGVTDLIAGKGSPRFASGDAPAERAYRIVKSVVSSLEALYVRLGRQVALGSRLPLEKLLRLEAAIKHK